MTKEFANGSDSFNLTFEFFPFQLPTVFCRQQGRNPSFITALAEVKKILKVKIKTDNKNRFLLLAETPIALDLSNFKPGADKFSMF